MPPKTLLDMAGIVPTPSRLSEAVLVVIDAQREYVDGALALPHVEPALNEIERLLGRARVAGTPTIHIVHLGKAGGKPPPHRENRWSASAFPTPSPAPISPIVWSH
jgi:nicotinamidase-related amidase